MATMTPDVYDEYKALRHAVKLQSANVRAVRLGLLGALKGANAQEKRLRDMTARLDAIRAMLPEDLRDADH
jgi:hypothetical protein